MNRYCVEVIGKGIGLITADSLEDATQRIRILEGINNVKSVRLATKADIQWIAGMGGRIPEWPTPAPTREEGT